jgi:hypothetical protein
LLAAALAAGFLIVFSFTTFLTDFWADFFTAFDFALVAFFRFAIAVPFTSSLPCHARESGHPVHAGFAGDYWVPACAGTTARLLPISSSPARFAD